MSCLSFLLFDNLIIFGSQIMKLIGMIVICQPCFKNMDHNSEG